MQITKTKKEAFPIYPISDWGVEKYGVELFINHIQPPLFLDGVSLDVEDDSQGNFVGLGIYGRSAMGGLEACYYWSDFELARTVIIPRFIAHNGVSDIYKLKQWGFDVTENHLIWDTQLMSHYIDSTRKKYGLKELAKADLGIEYPNYKDLIKRGKEYINLKILQEEDLHLVASYNAMDCLATYKLAVKQGFNGSPAPKYFTTFERPISFIFDKMSRTGISVDLAYLTKLKETLETQREPIKQQIHNELGPINLNSPKQLLGALHAKGITPNLKGKPSTDKRALESLRGVDVVSKLLQFSEVETLLCSFVTPYLERNEEVVHPQFHQTGTRTGRPSCSNPNLLQIPKRSNNGKLVRKMFIARPGYLFGRCDYKEGEPRMLAHLSQDADMLALFNEGRGFHDYFAEHLNISRDKAKVFDLETYYRATKYGVARHLNCGLNEAQRHIDEAWALFPGLYDWEQKVIYEAKKNGYITTLMGRRIRIEDLDNNNEWRRSAAERRCMNNLAQASLQECTKAAMIGIDKAGINILLQVYDDILIESPEEIIAADIEIMIDIMESTTILSIPMKVDSGIGKDWSEC